MEVDPFSQCLSVCREKLVSEASFSSPMPDWANEANVHFLKRGDLLLHMPAIFIQRGKSADQLSN